MFYDELRKLTVNELADMLVGILMDLVLFMEGMV